MKRFFNLLFIAVLAVAACTKPNNGQDSKTQPQTPTTEYQESIENVTISPTDNALRFNVEITKKKECSPVVDIRKKGEEEWMRMPGQIALFLYPSSEYECRVGVNDSFGDPLSFETGALPEGVPTYEMTLNEGGPTSGYILQHKESTPGYVTISDVYGKVIWYERFDEPVRTVDYQLETGKLALMHGTYLFPGDKTTPKPARQIIVMGLDGTRYLSIDASEQTVMYPHHELRLLPGGNMLTLNHTSREYDLTSVGKPKNSVVWSDIFVEIDSTGKPVWEWNIFDQMDIVAYWPILKEYRPKMGIMSDFVHTNSLDKDSDGNYYASLYYPEEIWKIDGKTKEVIYKYGPLGDVTIEGGYPLGGYHSVVVLAPDKFMVVKNPRKLTEPLRAQIIQVDPASKTAVKLMDVPSDVAFASTSHCNVQVLPDGETVMFNSTQGNALAFTDMNGKNLRVLNRSVTCNRALYFEKMF